MSKNRISTNSYRLENYLFREFDIRVHESSTLDLVRAKLDDILANELTDAQYTVVDMYYFQHLTQRQIAHTLHRDQSTVSRNLKRARAKVARILQYLI